MFSPCPMSLHHAAAKSTGELNWCPTEDIFAGISQIPSRCSLRSFSPWSCAVRPNFSNSETFCSSEITQRDLTALASCQGPKKLIKPCIIVSPPLFSPLLIHNTPERYRTPDGKLKTPIKWRCESSSFVINKRLLAEVKERFSKILDVGALLILAVGKQSN